MDPSPNPGYTAPEKTDPPSIEEIVKRVERLEGAVASLQTPNSLKEAKPAKNEEKSGEPNSQDAPSPKTRKWPTLFGMLKWFFYDVVPELRGMVSMFFDPRYKLGLSVRIVVFVLLALAITTTWWVPFSSIPIMGFLLDRVMMVVTAYFLFKLLIRESRRYRQLAPALPDSLRWPGKGEKE